jgi:hypothetical protein
VKASKRAKSAARAQRQTLNDLANAAKVDLAPAQHERAWLLWIMLALVSIVIVLLAVRQARKPTLRPVDVGAQGGVMSCRQIPLWMPSRAKTPRASLSTSERLLSGLVLLDPPSAAYQHASWRRAGNLGPLVIDKRGDVYLAPVPKINLIDNVPHEQNILWRVDAINEEMQEALRIPSPVPPQVDNPYGILGLTYDCETDLLYASTVMGSSRSHERGRIVAIDLSHKTIKSEFASGDALGMTIFRGASGKRLYYSGARAGQIKSIALTADGALQGDPRDEFSLHGLGWRGDDVARRMTVTSSDEMTVWGVEFGFNLVAPTEKKETVYRFRYQRARDQFTLVQIDETPIVSSP